MPSILTSHSDTVYLIAGALTRRSGLGKEIATGLSYRPWRRSSGGTAVLFVNRFVSPEEMASLVGRPTFTSRPTVMKRRRTGTLAYPWAPERPSSPLRTGTPRKCWTRDAECLCRLRTQPPSQLRHLTPGQRRSTSGDARTRLPICPADGLEAGSAVLHGRFPAARDHCEEKVHMRFAIQACRKIPNSAL